LNLVICIKIPSILYWVILFIHLKHDYKHNQFAEYWNAVPLLRYTKNWYNAKKIIWIILVVNRIKRNIEHSVCKWKGPCRGYIFSILCCQIYYVNDYFNPDVCIKNTRFGD
jgi:hypothetical protein